MPISLKQALAAPPAPKISDKEGPKIPKAGDPGTYDWNGSEGTYNTQPTTEKITTWDKYIIDAGLDPEEVEVVEPVQVRGWDSIKREWNAELGDFESNVVRMHYYRLTLRRKASAENAFDLDALVESIRNRPVVKAKPFLGAGSTFVVALSDGQLGKCDKGGPEATVARISACIDQAAEQLSFVSQFTTIETVLLSWLGDMVEGFVSQNGDSAWRTVLPLTDQLTVLRELMLYAIEKLYPLSPKLVCVAIPGNHDEAVRFGKAGVTTYSDSYDVDCLRAIKTACDLAGRFENLSFHFPEADELTVTLETSRTVISHVHGHKFKGGNAFAWWSGQRFGEQLPGSADILLSGHVHHLQVEQDGARTSVRVPALEQESTWFRHQTGKSGNPGIVTLLVNDGKMQSLSVLSGE